MMVEILRLSEGHAAAVEAFVQRQPAATLAHSPAWRSVFPTSLGHLDRSLVALRHGEVCGLLPLMHLRHWLFGTFTVSLPWLDYGGILADDPETAQALLDTATNQARLDGAEFVELRSVNPIFSDLPTRKEKVSFWLSLDCAEAVWKRIDPKVRRHVRTAQRAGLTVQFGHHELLKEFYEVFASNMRDLGTPVWSVSLFQQILKEFPRGVEIALVRLEEKTIGGGLVVSFKDTVHLPAVSSARSFFPLRPNNLLYWEVIKRACEQGYRIFDFGRSSVGAGTYEFKRHWGGEVIALQWQYVILKGERIPQLSPSNPRLKLLIEAWKRLPVSIANRLGPRIVRHLP